MTDQMPLLLRGDARNLPLPDASVDLVVTSPPYFGLRDYGTDSQIGSEPSPQEFLDALIECTAEMVRVLKPSGSLWVNLGDKYNSAASGQQNGNGHAAKSGLAGGRHDRMMSRGTTTAAYPTKSLHLLPERYRIRCVDELGLIARAVIVWSKPNGLPESVTDRVRRSHEDWVHLTRLPRYFAAVDEIREPHAGEFLSSGARNARYRKPGGRLPSELRGENSINRTPSGEWEERPNSTANPLGKLPGSVWEVATQPLNVPAELGVDHFAAFPMEWPRRLILGWSPPDGTVLDPFGGTGTTALVAAMLGRRGISVDLSADYQRIATWRCNDPKERARAAGLDPDQVAAIKPQLPGQESLLDLLGGEVA